MPHLTYMTFEVCVCISLLDGRDKNCYYYVDVQHEYFVPAVYIMVLGREIKWYICKSSNTTYS